MKRPAKNRVLILLPTSVYPHNAHLRQEALALTEAGYQVSVLSPRLMEDPAQPWRETLEGIRVYRYPAPPRRFNVIGYILGYAYSLLVVIIGSLLLLMRPGYDIVHIYTPPDLLGVVAGFLKLFGKKVVYDHRDLAPEMFLAIFGSRRKFYHRVLLRLEWICCRVADTIIAPNESYKRIEMQRGGVPARRIFVVRSGPDLKVIRPVDPDPALKQEGKTMLCYVGAMGLHDGVEYLLRALHCLAYDLKRTDFACLMVGRGKSLKKLQALAQELQLDAYVRFVGRVDHSEVVRYLGAADICLAPEPSNSYNDNSTVIKVNEYLAAGKPVVSFDLPEHRVTAQEAAVYAKPNEELDFAQKIAWLMDRPEKRAEMSRFGLERARTTLAWDYQVTQLLAAYESLQPNHL